MLKSLNHWVFSFILSQRITNPLTGKMHYHIHYHQSLCLSTADGIPRKTAKSKLEEVVLKEGDSTIVDNPREVVTESKHNSTCIVDLMAALRSVVQITENYEELTWKLLSSFPKGFQRVDIVANNYRLEKEKVVGAMMRLSLNRLNSRHQIFSSFSAKW